MAMRGHKGPRLFVAGLRALLHSGASPTLSSEDSHYLRDVLRCVRGDRIELADPDNGFTCIATVASLSPVVTLESPEIVEDGSLARPPLVLLCALCKGQKNELICDWATELGCSHIILWQATRSIVRLKNQSDANAKVVRLEKTVLAAAQQSRQPRPPTVSITLSLAEALKLLPEESLRVCCSLAPGAQDIKALAASSAILPQFGAVVAIGPEGDFTPEEEHTLLSDGDFTRASLGSAILRAELAAVVGLLSISGRKS
jgi:16S rRNA (uracil1498-N3)-methyltransferase